MSVANPRQNVLRPVCFSSLKATVTHTESQTLRAAQKVISVENWFQNEFCTRVNRFGVIHFFVVIVLFFLISDSCGHQIWVDYLHILVHYRLHDENMKTWWKLLVTASTEMHSDYFLDDLFKLFFCYHQLHLSFNTHVLHLYLFTHLNSLFHVLSENKYCKIYFISLRLKI